MADQIEMSFIPDWDDHAHARNRDPETSHEAAAAVDVTHREGQVLDILRRHPEGLCGKQAADLLGVQIDSIRPRFAPLERKGFISRTGERRLYKGTNHIVWKAN